MKKRLRGSRFVALIVGTTVATNIAWQFIPLTSISAAAPSTTSKLPGGATHDTSGVRTQPVQSGMEQINHQGVVAVNGQRFTGTGQFRFAIVDPDAGVNRWTNDGSNLGVSGVPTTAVSLVVTNGIYNVRFGDKSVANMTSPIPASIFSDSNLQLRVWFNDGSHGQQQLTPDQPIVSSGYAMSAATSPPIGAIIAWHKNLSFTPDLPYGWVECNGQTLNDGESPYNLQAMPDLNSTPPGIYPPPNGGGRFLRGSSHSGDYQNASDHVLGSPGIRYPAGGSLMDNEDGQLTYTINRVYLNESPDCNCGWQYGYSRPVNMSVVWIIRVK